MKKILFIVFIVVFVGISFFFIKGMHHLFFQGTRIVQIVRQDPKSGIKELRGVGYYLSRDLVITSAHVVPDDRWIYYAIHPDKVSDKLTVVARLGERDIAYLSVSGSQDNISKHLLQSYSNIGTGDTLSVPLFRSGSLVWIKAYARSVDYQVLAYSSRGASMVFSGIILPDIPFLPGDSGAPIFNMWGKLIDVVHVE